MRAGRTYEKAPNDEVGRRGLAFFLSRGMLVVFFFAAPAAVAQEPPPVLDMHLHAHPADFQGPPPRALCAPFSEFPVWDQTRPWPQVFAELQSDPPCANALWSPETDEALRDRTLAELERLNVYGVLSGPPDRVNDWRERAPDRVIPGLELFQRGIDVSPERLRRLHATDSVHVIAEIVSQYAGIAPDGPELEPFWAVAEELDIPVGIHVHPGPPGAPYFGQPTHELHSPLLLQDVLLEHPNLRLYVIHAGWPKLDDILTLMYTHPQVYVELGGLAWIHPRADAYRYLRAIVEAGMGNRVMFGSDQMIWPGAIERAIRTIEEAPFLTEAQKRAILYDNAARFLRLSDAEIARHHGR